MDVKTIFFWSSLIGWKEVREDTHTHTKETQVVITHTNTHSRTHNHTDNLCCDISFPACLKGQIMPLWRRKGWGWKKILQNASFKSILYIKEYPLYKGYSFVQSNRHSKNHTYNHSGSSVAHSSARRNSRNQLRRDWWKPLS